jgi:tetratricopeptide (TPR) repeat protein
LDLPELGTKTVVVSYRNDRALEECWDRHQAGTEIGSGPKAKSALVKAEEHMAEGRLPEAMDLAYKAIDYKDDYAEAWLTLATLRLGQGNFAAAKRPAENATELDPDSPEAHFMLGLSNYAVGEFDDALESFSMAISLESQMDLARVFLADTYSVLGNYELAVEEINAAIGPDLDAAYRAWALGPDLDAADRAWALSIRSEAFGELGQYDKAIDDCLAAVEANELEPLAHYACGINYHAIGDEEKAAEYLNASLLNGLDYIQRQEALRLLNEIEG